MEANPKGQRFGTSERPAMASGQKTFVLNAALFLYILVIFLSIPYIPLVTKAVGSLFGQHVFGWIVVLLTLGIYSVTCVLIRKNRPRDISRSLLWISIVAGLYLLLAAMRWRQAVETLHLMQYGLLSWLLFQTLQHRIQDGSLFLRCALIVLFIGILDEIIQWFTPGRTWGFNDIWTNFSAGALVQIAAWKVFWRAEGRVRIPPGSIRAASAWGVASLLLIGLCISNTHSRFFYYKKKHPYMANFPAEKGMMQDFGHIISDPQIGNFYSRFTVEELRRIDLYGVRVHREPLVMGGLTSREYRKLLKAYTARTFPFLRELQLHAILRDGNYDLARKAGSGRNETLLEAAYRENQILLTYYGNTLKRSVYVWPRGRMESIEDRIVPRERYESPANTRLVTELSEKGVWTGIFMLIAVVSGLNLAYGRHYGDDSEQKPF
jgi:VanZ family protein